MKLKMVILSFLGLIYKIFLIILLVSPVYAEVIERVVAFVDDEAITLSEFREYFIKLKNYTPDITPKDAIETLINRYIILKEAKKLNIKGNNNDEIIKKYIDIKIRAYIKISNDEIEKYYHIHKKSINKEFNYQIRNEIKKLLIEKKVNKKLKRYLKEIRKKYYVKVNFIPIKISRH